MNYISVAPDQNRGKTEDVTSKDAEVIDFVTSNIRGKNSQQAHREGRGIAVGLFSFFEFPAPHAGRYEERA